MEQMLQCIFIIIAATQQCYCIMAEIDFEKGFTVLLLKRFSLCLLKQKQDGEVFLIQRLTGRPATAAKELSGSSMSHSTCLVDLQKIGKSSSSAKGLQIRVFTCSCIWCLCVCVVPLILILIHGITMHYIHTNPCCLL